jgi:hypothetical protein
MPFASARYATSRSSVHEANGSPSAWGFVSAAAMTSAICSGEYVGGHPERGRSSSPASPSRLNRLIQRRTVSGSTPHVAAISPAVARVRACQMSRARSTVRAGAVRACTSCSNALRSSRVSVRSSSGCIPAARYGPPQRRISRAA